MESQVLPAPITSRRSETATQKHNLECATCGYGIARPVPPERCPMCQADGTWVHAAWRPFSAHL
jgi:rubrerythrin